MPFQDQDQPLKRICVGKISGAHGVKGLVKILPLCEDHSLLEQTLEHTIKIKSSAGKHLLAEIEGVASREAADALRHTELHITRDQLPEIEDENSFYYEDLVGLACVDENGTDIGKVIAVQNFGAGDLLEIQPQSGQSILVPFTDETIIEVNESGIQLADISQFIS